MVLVERQKLEGSPIYHVGSSNLLEFIEEPSGNGFNLVVEVSAASGKGLYEMIHPLKF